MTRDSKKVKKSGRFTQMTQDWFRNQGRLD